MSAGRREQSQLVKKIKMASICYYKAAGGGPTARTGETPLPGDLKITPEQWSLLAGPNSQPYTTDGCIMGNPYEYTIATDEENVKSVLALLWLNQEIKLSL